MSRALPPSGTTLPRLVGWALVTRPDIGGTDFAVDGLAFGHGDVYVEADEDRPEQAIWCLVWNAVRSSPRGGTIRVETARVGTDVLVRVRDSGEGIDRGFLPHVFDAFRQAPSAIKRPGLGLGLSLVKHIVELHGPQTRAASSG